MLLVEIYHHGLFAWCFLCYTSWFLDSPSKCCGPHVLTSSLLTLDLLGLSGFNYWRPYWLKCYRTPNTFFIFSEDTGVIWFTNLQTMSLFLVRTLYIIFNFDFYLLWYISGYFLLYFMSIMTEQTLELFKVKALTPATFQQMPFWPDSYKV